MPRSSLPVRANVLVAVDHDEADWIKKRYLQYRFYVVLTPDEKVSGFVVGEYVWSPGARNLPPRVRLALRGVLAPLIDGKSVEEEFPEALLSW